MTVKSRFNELAKQFDRTKYRKLNETMTFSEYLEKVHTNPKVTYSAYQRLYNMILSAGTYEIQRYRKTVTKYKFFNDPDIPIHGLEDTLNSLVKHVKGAASWHGPEKRILLLHGPVGSSKSTICRLLKRGLERHSQTDDGAIYTYTWTNLGAVTDENGQQVYPALDIKDESKCPLNDDPLKLVPTQMRKDIEDRLNTINEEQAATDKKGYRHKIKLTGELNPHCQYFMDRLLERYDGDWGKVVENHIRVHRIILSESKRIGIGTFQPKDPKNQDATELTGDINYTKLAHYGVDSDPRAFGFDGEFEIANRGFIEFIEVLKLEKEFLYDLLGVCQERQFKPKKFPQIDVDMVIFGHSVHGKTPVPHEYKGVLDVLPIEQMSNLDIEHLRVFSVNVNTGQVELSKVKKVFSHRFEGEWVENHQDGDTLVTTPNHSVYNKKLEKFYPGEDESSEIATFQIPAALTGLVPTTQRWKDFFRMK